MTLGINLQELQAPTGVYKYYKDGQWLESLSGKSVKIINPSTNEACFQVQGERDIPTFLTETAKGLQLQAKVVLEGAVPRHVGIFHCGSHRPLFVSFHTSKPTCLPPSSCSLYSG